jgi:hypothetical protein
VGCGERHEAVVKLGLLAMDGVHSNSKDTEWDRTPLSWAAKNGGQATSSFLGHSPTNASESVRLSAWPKWAPMMVPLLAIFHTCVGLVDLSHECTGLYFPENGIESPGHGTTSRTSCAMLEEALPGAISEGATIFV